MIYKNSMKLLTSNFSLVWKQLAYTLLRLAIIIGLTILVSRPILDILAANGFAQSLAHLWESVYTNTLSFFPALKETIELFVSIIAQNLSQVWPFLLLFFLVTIVINAFLKNMGKYALTFVAHNKFTSLNKCGYSHSLVSNLANASKYALSRLALDVPFTTLKALCVVVYCKALNNWALAIIGITLLMIIFTITYALQITIYNNLAVEQIANRKNSFKSAFRGYKSQKDFAKVFSNAIIVVVTVLLVNIIIGIFTVGAGLFITVPASMALVVIFELISYYTTKQQRYYLSPTIIVDTSGAGKIERI